MARVNCFVSVSAECRNQPISVGGRTRNNYADVDINTETASGEVGLQVAARVIGTLTAAERRKAKEDTRRACFDIGLPSGAGYTVEIEGLRDFQQLVRSAVHSQWEELLQNPDSCGVDRMGWLLGLEERVAAWLTMKNVVMPDVRFLGTEILGILCMRYALQLLSPVES